MSELNREEIIKALECHLKNEKENTCGYCTNCPASEYDLCEGVTTDDCVDEMFTATILLINELTEANKSLKYTISQLGKNNAELARVLPLAKKEVEGETAREIFEEIEKVRQDCTLTVDDRDYFQLSKFEKNIAELKKKYIGEDINVLANTEGE